MPSPFPPIADYGFLSDCHTGALVAPDGGVDWLCVPRFDSPSVFGCLLDREAGMFRLGPFGINVPTQRTYEPGTNVLTPPGRRRRAGSWCATPSRWGRPRDRTPSRRTRGRPPTTTPSTRSCARRECIDGHVEIELVCEPVFDYGETAGDVDRSSTRTGTRPTPSGADLTLRLHTDLSMGVEGNQRPGPPHPPRR